MTKNLFTEQKHKLTLVTMGDPAAIGLYLTLLAWNKYHHLSGHSFCVLGNSKYLEKLSKYYQLSVPIKAVGDIEEAQKTWNQALPVINICDKIYGSPGQPSNGDVENILRAIELGVEYCLQDQYSYTISLLTNPVCKQQLYRCNFNYGGQTEYIAHLCDLSNQKVAMLFMSKKMLTMPLTYHIPVSSINTYLKKYLIKNRIKILQKHLQDQGIHNPHLALICLNPHGGENGFCGTEELQVLNPIAITLRKQGVDITNASTIETLFQYQNYDAFICPYHDQALLPIKMLNYFTKEGVINLTAGLPFIRTSPAHGTAFDLAAKDQCKNINSASFNLALEYTFYRTCRSI